MFINIKGKRLRSRWRTPTAPIVALLLAGAVLAGCSSSGSTSLKASDAANQASAATIPTRVPAGTTLRVADQQQGLEQLFAASGAGHFASKVEYSNFVGGPPMLQAFQAGAVDVGTVASTPLIFAQAAHQDVVGVAVWTTPHSSFGLVTAPGVGDIKGWKDLKGKKVAYQQGTAFESILLQGLHSAGLTLKDVQGVNLPYNQITAALAGGSVQAGILSEPTSSAYLANNSTAKLVLHTTDITTRSTYLIASQAALANPAKAAAIADYLRALVKAYGWVATHQTAWAQTYYVDQYKLPLAEGEKLLAETGSATFAPLPGPYVAPQQQLIDLYVAAGEIPAKIDASAEFDGRYNAIVKAAQAEPAS